MYQRGYLSAVKAYVLKEATFLEDIKNNCSNENTIVVFSHGRITSRGNISAPIFVFIATPNPEWFIKFDQGYNFVRMTFYLLETKSSED